MENWTEEIDEVLDKALEGVNAEDSMDLLKKLYTLISYPESKELVEYQFNVYLKKKKFKA